MTQRWFVLDARCAVPLPSWGGIDPVLDPRRPATFMRLSGDRYRWGFRMHPDETTAGLVGRIDELTARWRDGPPTASIAVLRATEYVFRARIADRWRDGRVLLLGDAAHLTPPFVGQGLGAGLRDAHNLAWKIAALLHDRPSAAEEDALLGSYQRERAPHAEATIRAAVRVGRAMTGGQDITAAVRGPLTRLLLRVPGVRARAVGGTATRYPAGPYVDRRRHHHDLAGTLCPQPWVRVDGRWVRLDDVLGNGYVLLHRGPVPSALAARAQRLGARTVALGPRGDHDSGELAAWLLGWGIGPPRCCCDPTGWWRPQPATSGQVARSNAA